jgi:hypothetical protein
MLLCLFSFFEFNFAENLVMLFFALQRRILHFLKNTFFQVFLTFFFAKIVKIHHKRKHYLCNTKILRAKNTDLQTTSVLIFLDKFCHVCSTKKLGNSCFPRVNLTKIFFFGGKICQIVHIQKNKNKNSE